MFRQSELRLDPDWPTNGLKNLRFKKLSEKTEGLLYHVVVELESGSLAVAHVVKGVVRGRMGIVW